MKKKLASLWLKQGPKGDYLTGTLADGTRVIAFYRSAESKKNPKQPDLEIYEQEPKAQSAEQDIFGNDSTEIPF